MPDAGGPASLASLAHGADPTAHPGPGGALAILAATQEPASVGDPPVAPVNVSDAGKDYSDRWVRSLSGHTHTSSLATVGRTNYTVEWDGLTQAQKATLSAWLRTAVGGRRRAFNVQPEGSGDKVAVRAVTLVSGGRADRGVFFVRAQCEEVFRDPA